MKIELLAKITELLDEKIASAHQAIESAKESRDSETKSSVGDKYETGRTLMQLEVEKNRVQLHKTEILKSELLKIDLKKKFNKVEFGALVKTSQHNYFISAAIGRVEINTENFMCISMASPIGKQLHTKKIGDTFLFQGKQVEITDIL
jgi:transcription elongation GreA/GreB family factor